MSESAGAAAPRGGGLAWGALVAALILGVNAAYVISSLGFLHKPRKVLETDHFRYIEMARDPWSAEPVARTAPFCWRVLTPWLAFLLGKAGLGLNAAFYLLTNVFLFAFLLTLFVGLRERGFGLGASLTGQALVGLLQGAVRWYEYQYWMSDPLCLFLLALGLLLMRRRQARAFALASVAGVLARESYLLVLPGHALRGLREARGRAQLARALLVPGLALGTLLLLRLAVHPANPPDTLRTIAGALGFRWRHLLDNQLYLLGFGSFGVLFPLALLFPGRLLAWGRTRYDEALLVAGAYLSLALGNNTERLLAYALPGLAPLALAQLEAYAAQARVPGGALAAVCLGLQLVVWAQTRLLGEQGLSAYQPANAPVAALLGVFWLACRWRLHVVARRVEREPGRTAD